MTIDRDTDRALRAWFNEPAAPLPDRVLDTVLAGLPGVRQRTWSLPGRVIGSRRWLRLTVVAAAVIALLAGLLLGAGGRLLVPEPRRLSIEELRPIDPGRYVVDDQFPARFGITIPGGWQGVELTNDVFSVVKTPREMRGGLHMTYAEAVYIDPCHPENGLERVGPSPDDLVQALARLPSVIASPVSHRIIDGRTAAYVELTTSADLSGCTLGFEVLVWDLPEPYFVQQGHRHRIWVLELDGLRLIIAALDLGPSSAEAADVDALIASLDFDAALPPRPSASSAAPAGPTEPPIPVLPATGLVPPGVHRVEVPVYWADAGGTFQQGPGSYDAVVELPPGWYATERGVAAAPGDVASARFEVWTIATFNRDPCHWHSADPGSVDAATLRTVDAIAAALAASWPATSNPADGRPRATSPVLVSWLSDEAWRLAVDVPQTLMIEDCDDHEYRLWSDPAGAVRRAQPGEHIELRITAIDQSIIVAAAGHVVDASVPDVQGLELIFDSNTVMKP